MIESKNFYYSVEFFSRDVFLSASGVFCCIVIGMMPEAEMRKQAINIFNSITWIQLVLLVGAFLLLSVAWSFVAFRCFKSIIWNSVDALFSRRFDYGKRYSENKEKIEELYARLFRDEDLLLESYADESDLRLRMNVLLYLAQLRFPHGYVYLQRLWGIQSMLGSMVFTSSIIAICGLILGTVTVFVVSLAFAVFLTLSYGGMVLSNTNEELKVLAAMEVHRQSNANAS